MKLSKKTWLITAASLAAVVLLATGGLAVWQHVRLNKTTTAMASVNESLTQAESDRDAYKTEAEKAQKEKQQLQQQVDDLEKQLEELENSLKSAQSEKNALQEKNKALQQQIALMSASNKPADTNAATTGKVCYLTFDDGPSQNTLSVLNTLKKYNVKATFFVVGSGNMSYLSKIHAQGHAIALHCNSHTYSQVYASESAYLADLKAVSDKVEAATGTKSMVVRFPGGSSNTVSRNYSKGLMSRLSKLLPEMGYAYFDWNISSGDASGNNIPAATITRKLLNGAKGKSKICVLMHDGAGKATTAAALPGIIEGLKAQGFSFAVLTPEVSGFKHGVNN